MINLIPPRARKHITHEYWIRVASLGMFALGSVAFLTVIFLAPSFVLVNLQLRALTDSVVEANAGSENYQALSQVILETNKQSLLLSEQASRTELTTYISLIDSLLTGAIDLQTLEVSQNSDGVSQPIMLVGTAATRADLADLKDRLEQRPEFDTVDLPISNLAKDVDVDFSVRVILSSDDVNNEETAL